MENNESIELAHRIDALDVIMHSVDSSFADIAEEMMYNTFNMGIGMVLAVDPADVEATMKAIEAAGEKAYIIGKVEAGEKGVTLC